MKAIIISIGDELLIGNTLNTNSHWLGQQLTQLSISVHAHWSIADKKEDIKSTLRLAESLADVILITGGLGPTNDDLTVETLGEYFQKDLVYHDEVWQNIRNFYISRNRPVHEPSKKLAYLPSNAIVIPNTQGTAPGSIYWEQNKLIASMPGVPYEMKAMMELTVIPFIKKHFKLPYIIHSHIYTAGVGETTLSDALVEFEKNLPEHFSLAYLPSVGKVRLRLSGHGENEAELKNESEQLRDKIIEAIQPYVYSTNEPLLEKAIGDLVKSKGLLIGTAESCTGGYISHLITKIPGSSDYYKGSIISYSNEIKMSALGVQAATLEQYGAVSEETVSEMLSGALKNLDVDVAIAVSGVAGPDGGSEEKPVGCVYIGIANSHEQYIRRCQFTNNRERNIEMTAINSLVMLKKFIEQHYH